MRRARTAVVVIVAVTLLAVVWLLPPATHRTAPPGERVVRGAYHAHTDRSDGSGSPDGVAAAAAAAGLRFVILTDHGDGTREPDPPSYRSGVLVIDAVEVNTSGGHLAILGIGRTPYPLAGAASAVLEDVHRLGGFGIAAHPGSPRPSLSWREWDAPIDGIEWINGDSEWRDELRLPIARALLTYLLRAPESIATLLDHPTAVLARWDELNARRQVFTFAGIDAHARLGFSDEDPDRWSMHLPIPGYAASFRTLTNHVVLDQPFTGDASADGARLLTAIRQGRSYSVADALATPGALTFTATSGSVTRSAGEILQPSGTVVLHASVAAPPGTTLVLIKNGARVHNVTDAPMTYEASGDTSVYRLEAYVRNGPGAPPVPWIVSNPIHVGRPAMQRGPADSSPSGALTPVSTADATTEEGSRDRSEVRKNADAGSTMSWTFALATGEPSGQFAALQVPIGGLQEFSGVRFKVSAANPIRCWVQLRVPEGNLDRWGSTFYADSTERVIEIAFADLRAIGAAPGGGAPLDRVRSLLFVVDTLNSRPGSNGAITLSEISLVK